MLDVISIYFYHILSYIILYYWHIILFISVGEIIIIEGNNEY